MCVFVYSFVCLLAHARVNSTNSDPSACQTHTYLDAMQFYSIDLICSIGLFVLNFARATNANVL